MFRPTILSALILGMLAGLPAAKAQSWKILISGADSNLRSITVAHLAGTNQLAIWASGSHGTIFRSIDDGASWSRLDVPGGSDLDFRGIVAFNEKTSYTMASGEGEKSRIYKTVNGGATWKLQFKGKNNSVFFDSIECLSPTSCFVLGDPINGKFLILRTSDGLHWTPLPQENLPVALPKEAAFAASNSNLLLRSENEFYVITGGAAARVLHTTDGGKTWSASSLPIAADNVSSGIFSIARSVANHFVAVGGDYANPMIAQRIAAFSSDAAGSWASPVRPPHGYRSAVVAPDAGTFVAVGPSGSDISIDAGANWRPFDAPPLNALFALDPEHIYAAGAKGTVAQLLLGKTE